MPISIPGVAEGVLRLDPLAYGVLGVGVLDASGVSPALQFLVPNNPLLVGASFDVQGADLDGAGLITLTDNDLEIEVAAPPPASLNMVPIAAGMFQMGSPVTPLYVAPYNNQPTAQPVHAVTITRPFWMGKYEVTQAEYQAVMGSNPSYFLGANLPVERVFWNQAVAYCDALTVQEAAAGRLPSGYEYRLPTEAEWEYCCRAGTTTEFHYGSTLVCGQASFRYSYHTDSMCSFLGTAVVGSYAANAWGLHDMHGNMWEWCLDSWDGSANYPAGSVSDPYVASGPYRVARGGGWGSGSNICRSANRSGYVPVSGDAGGFRVVCAPVR
ncbi:MAG: formylglycine-generating enzyme family protein [Planctomycetes bacterium]|nr:formylglycine-generating enzyme family protein [Planctomycetota bacterium]